MGKIPKPSWSMTECLERRKERAQGMSSVQSFVITPIFSPVDHELMVVLFKRETRLLSDRFRLIGAGRRTICRRRSRLPQWDRPGRDLSLDWELKIITLRGLPCVSHTSSQ